MIQRVDSKWSTFAAKEWQAKMIPITLKKILFWTVKNIWGIQYDQTTYKKNSVWLCKIFACAQSFDNENTLQKTSSSYP